MPENHTPLNNSKMIRH